MIVPTIHLNGTGQQYLLDQANETVSALNVALDTMMANGPNCRDYYPQGPDACAAAIKEHQARVLAIRAVVADCCQLAEAIADGGHKVQP